MLRACLVPCLVQKILGFNSTFCRIELNNDCRFALWILASRAPKKAQKSMFLCFGLFWTEFKSISNSLTNNFSIQNFF